MQGHIEAVVMMMVGCIIMPSAATSKVGLHIEAVPCEVGWLVEWGFYALSASKAIFRARTYNCNLFSPVMMTT